MVCLKGGGSPQLPPLQSFSRSVSMVTLHICNAFSISNDFQAQFKPIFKEIIKGLHRNNQKVALYCCNGIDRLYCNKRAPETDLLSFFCCILLELWGKSSVNNTASRGRVLLPSSITCLCCMNVLPFHLL